MQELHDIIKFVELTHQFQNIQRQVLVPDGSRYENDIEHSYQLGMLGWYLVVHDKLPLDASKVLKYGLVHDLVEAYAGDTYAFEPDQEVVASKSEREDKAATRLREEFPDFEELHDLIAGYKNHADDEAVFVYALDKIVPMLNIYLSNGESWQKKGVTLDMILNYKADKVGLSKPAKKYFDLLVHVLKEKESQLFTNPSHEKE